MQHLNNLGLQRRKLLAVWMLAALLTGWFTPALPAPALAAEIVPTAAQQQALDRINYYRKLAGVPPARLEPALMQSASGHANYISLNGWSGNPHVEVATRAGFIGEEMDDRARKFGYSGSVNEDMGAVGNPVRAVDELMNTVSHRVPFLEPAYTDIGYGLAAGTNKADVISFGAPINNFTFNPPVIQWPPNNYASFGTTFWGESPTPFSGVSYPVGNPVTLIYRGSGKFEFLQSESFLLDQAGQPVDVITAAGNFWTTRNTFILAARKPLLKDSTYTATMSYKIDGQKATRTWSFSTGLLVAPAPAPVPAPTPAPAPVPAPTPVIIPVPAPVAGSLKLPISILAAPLTVQQLWRSVDGPVLQSIAGATWFYGPDVFKAASEEYAESPGRLRQVWYLDKARLEINNPQSDAQSDWYVTSGLLPKELISGKMQTGDYSFKDGAGPARVPVAGDLLSNPNAPTYASFSRLASLSNDHRVAQKTGQFIKESINAAGNIAVIIPPVEIANALYDKVLGHNIPVIFADYFKTLPREWLYIMGLPLTEAYWIKVKVGGSEKDVLVQVFERRVLTYTPSNTAQWRVEMGNVGLHYKVWRYK